MEKLKESYKVKHHPARNRFESEVEGLIGYVEYIPFHGGIDIIRTVIPPSLRGKGLAQSLVAEALKYARDNGLRVIPSCSFVAAYFRRYPDEADCK